MSDGNDLEGLSLDDLEYTVLVDHSSSILVVDDEDIILKVFEELLSDTTYEVGYAESAEQALSKLAREQYNLLIVDKNLPGESGIELVRKVRAIWPESQFIVITGYASYDSAVEALRLGAYDYLEKPFNDLMVVREKIDRALEKQRLLHENVVLADQLRSVHKDLRSKDTALDLSREQSDGTGLALQSQFEELRVRLGHAALALQQAFCRFQVLSVNRLVPEQPGQEIQDLLEQSCTLLSAALGERENVLITRPGSGAQR